MKVVMLQKGRTSPVRFHIQGFPWVKAHDPWKGDSLKVPDRIQSFQFFCQQGTSHFVVCNFLLQWFCSHSIKPQLRAFLAGSSPLTQSGPCPGPGSRPLLVQFPKWKGVKQRYRAHSKAAQHQAAFRQRNLFKCLFVYLCEDVHEESLMGWSWPSILFQAGSLVCHLLDTPG